MNLREAAVLVGISHSAISQYESGKLKLPTPRIRKMTQVYGYNWEEYLKLSGREIVFNLKDECLAIIKKMTDEQLAVIQPVMFAVLNFDDKKLVPSR